MRQSLQIDSHQFRSSIAAKGTALVVQWLRHCVPNAGSRDLIPGQGTKIPRAAQDSACHKGWPKKPKTNKQNVLQPNELQKNIVFQMFLHFGIVDKRFLTYSKTGQGEKEVNPRTLHLNYSL